MKEFKVKGGVIYQADCLRLMKRMEPQSVDLIVCSPPYEDARDYLEDGKNLGIALETEDWVRWMVKVVEASLRVCRGLSCFVVGHGKGARRWSGGPALLEADLIRKGICLRRTMYYKRNGIMGSGGNDYVRADVERIIVAANDAERLNWSDNTACGHPPKYGAGGKISHRNKDGTRVSGSGVSATSADRRNLGPFAARRKDPNFKYIPPEKSNPGDVIECKVGGGHMGSNISHENEAPMPLTIPEFFIKSFCRPSGVVFDPFGGSGTTIQAAIQSGRKFIACDLRMSQVKLMERRVKQAHRQKGFFSR